MKATMFEARTNLSEPVKRAQAGEEVVITSGREKKPVARIQAIEPVKTKRLGWMSLPDSSGWSTRTRCYGPVLPGIS